MGNCKPQGSKGSEQLPGSRGRSSDQDAKTLVVVNAVSSTLEPHCVGILDGRQSSQGEFVSPSTLQSHHVRIQV